jgi:hypothetical protein
MDKENKKFHVNFSRQTDLAEWNTGLDNEEIMNSTAKFVSNDFFTNDVNISTISSIPGLSSANLSNIIY